MEKTRLQKLLAVLLAGGIALTSSTAMAKKKESAASAKPAKTIEEEVKIPSIDDLCLTEEFITFLKQNNIQIVDGIIVIENVEQFKLIAQYFKDYLSSIGIESDIETVSKYIVAHNLDAITESLCQQLLDAGIISSNDTNYFSAADPNYIKLVTDIMNKKADCVKSGDITNYPSNTSIIINLKERQCMLYLESYDKKFIHDEERDKDYYTNMQKDILEFLNGKESTFPYSKADMGANFDYLFFDAACNLLNNVGVGNGPTNMELVAKFLDQSYSDGISKNIDEYIANFPKKPNIIVKK